MFWHDRLRNEMIGSRMITARQIRAARALLEWSGTDLAKKSGLTQMTISNIESDKVQPSEDSLQSIQAAFDMHGIEFLEGDGVRVRQQEVRIFSGKVGYRQFLDHVYATLKSGGRIRQFFVNERSGPSFTDEYGKAHIVRMADIKNLDAKVLCTEGDTELPAPYCSYRWISKADTDLAPFYLYGDNVVLPMHESANKMEWISINSKLMAERYAKQFDKSWANASVPKKTKRG